MLDYTGIKCPVCDVPFGKDDDIVVCPQCGAPYHRECYQQKGECIFDDLHREEKDWQPPAPPKPQEPTAEEAEKPCPVCGTQNGENALFCSRCGSPLGDSQAQPGTQPPYTQPYAPTQRNAYGGTVPPFAFDPMGGVSPADPLDDNVTFGDASKFVKQNTAYYMPVFRYIKQTGRNKFNFSAFLFSGPWMLFRKQYKFGAIVTALMFTLYLAYRFLYMFVSLPVLLNLMEQINIDTSAALSLTNEQYMEMAQLLTQDGTSYFLLCCPFLCLLAMLVIMIFVGIKGNKMYMRHCVRTVSAIKESNPGGDCGSALISKGGVNIAIAGCMLACYFVAQYVPLLFI